MYHSITFGTKNTWDDWHLIPSSRPVFNPPAFKEKLIDIPGINGQLDISTILTGGEPTFNNRQGSFEFIVENDFLSWDTAYSNIMNHLHGRSMEAVLEDDPDWIYDGRFTVNEWRSNKNFSTIVIDYNVSPYKKDLTGSNVDWEWDPFDFDTGLIQDYQNMVVNNTTVIVEGRQKQLYLAITSSVIMSVTINGVAVTLSAGINVLPTVVLGLGTNTFVFTGSGTVSINYRGGSL